jgi:hypothetical protein
VLLLAGKAYIQPCRSTYTCTLILPSLSASFKSTMFINFPLWRDGRCTMLQEIENSDVPIMKSHGGDHF